MSDELPPKIQPVKSNQNAYKLNQNLYNEYKLNTDPKDKFKSTEPVINNSAGKTKDKSTEIVQEKPLPKEKVNEENRPKNKTTEHIQEKIAEPEIEEPKSSDDTPDALLQKFKSTAFITRLDKPKNEASNNIESVNSLSKDFQKLINKIQANVPQEKIASLLQLTNEQKFKALKIDDPNDKNLSSEHIEKIIKGISKWEVKEEISNINASVVITSLEDFL